MKIRRNHKKIITGALILSAVSAIVPSVAQAKLADVLIGGFFSYGVKVIGWLIQGIAALALTVVGYLLNLSIDINLSITNLQVNTILEVGWKITRDVANLGFVLAIIIIAFATILRFQEYGAKKLLTRLIIMALLVNFSFTIAAGFINVSNAFTNFFINERIGGFSQSFGLAGSLTAAFNPQRLLVGEGVGDGPIPLPLAIEDEAGGLSTVTTALLVSMAGLFFSAAFLLILVITYGAMAIMFIIRYIALTFLIIISPIAWLLYAVPKMSNQFDKWWSLFLKWVFFAPIMSFFIYLALVAAKGLQFERMTLVSGGGILGFSDVVRNIAIQGSQMIVLAGILLGGLMAANSMSIHGASGAMGMVKGAGNKIKTGARTFAGRQALRGVSRPLRSEAGRKATEKLQQLGVSRGRILRTISAPVRRAGTALSRGRASVEKVSIDRANRNITGLSYQEMSRRYSTGETAEKMVVLQKLKSARNDIKTRKARAEVTKMSTKASASARIRAEQELEEINKLEKAIGEAMQTLPTDVKKDFDKYKKTYEERYGEKETKPSGGGGKGGGKKKSKKKP